MSGTLPRSSGGTLSRGSFMGTLPRTPGTERKMTSASRKVKSISMLLRKEPAGGSRPAKDALDLEGISRTELQQRLMESVLPLFTGEGVQETIENLNRIVVQLMEHGPDAAIDVVQALLGLGMTSISEKLTPLANDKLVVRLVDSWAFFISSVLPYLQGVLEPLHQLRDEGSGSSIVVRDFVLQVYRKEVILPLLDRMNGVLENAFIEHRHDRRFLDQYMRLIQLFATLASLDLNDDAQQKIDTTLQMLKANYVRRARAYYGSSPDFGAIAYP